MRSPGADRKLSDVRVITSDAALAATIHTHYNVALLPERCLGSKVVRTAPSTQLATMGRQQGGCNG